MPSFFPRRNRLNLPQTRSALGKPSTEKALKRILAQLSLRAIALPFFSSLDYIFYSMEPWFWRIDQYRHIAGRVFILPHFGVR
jgi:hypothetical protein